jgi:hypothetical protein
LRLRTNLTVYWKKLTKFLYKCGKGYNYGRNRIGRKFKGQAQKKRRVCGDLSHKERILELVLKDGLEVQHNNADV